MLSWLMERITRRILLGTLAALATQPIARLALASHETKIVTGANIFNGLYTPHFEKELEELASMRASLVRVIVPKQDIDTTDCAKQLSAFLSVAAEFHLKVIPVLINFYGDHGQYPRGTERFYTEPTGSEEGTSVLNGRFFRQGYQEEYRSYVQEVVRANRHHNNIFAWEVGNELRTVHSPADLVRFMGEMTQAIQSIDPNHYLASGLVNTTHANLTPGEFYSRLPEIRYVTVHDYDNNQLQGGLTDVLWAKRNGRVPVVEELGYQTHKNRVDAFEEGIRVWIKNGVSDIMIGAFMAKGSTDAGNGDHQFGMDNKWHQDYNKLFRLLKSYGSNFVKG